MGGLAAGKLNKPVSGHSPPLGTSSVDSQSCVSFKGSSLFLDLEAQPRNYENREEKGKARCNLCCAWASLVIGAFMLILLLLWVIFFAFFESNVPDFSLQRLTVNTLQFNTTGDDILMDSDIEVVLNATNKDTNIEFHYSRMRADIFSSGVSLGRVHLPGIHQKTKNSTVLKLHAVVGKQPVAEADSLKLQNDLRYHRLVIAVDLKGIIRYNIKGKQITEFSFKVSCNNMVQYEIDERQLTCNVKLTPLT